MPVIATQKFNYVIDGQTRIFYPGNVIENVECAAWALQQKHGEERDDEPAEAGRTRGSKPSAEMRTLGKKSEGAAPENKAEESAPANKKKKKLGRPSNADKAAAEADAGADDDADEFEDDDEGFDDSDVEAAIEGEVLDKE